MDEFEYEFPKTHALLASLSATDPPPVFQAKVVSEQKMDPKLVDALGYIFINIDANVREGMTRTNVQEVFQEFGFTFSEQFLDEVFASQADLASSAIVVSQALHGDCECKWCPLRM